MLEWFIAVLAGLGPSPDSEALRSTAPRMLTIETAPVHLWSARVAGFMTGTDPDLLLSIAAHESNYTAGERTPETGGTVSCGVMTPEPLHDGAACDIATSSILAGYLAGARHLRRWLRYAHGDLTTALSGYAGGGRFIRACHEGPVYRERNGVLIDLCDTPRVFTGRAEAIRWARVRARHAVS